MNTGYIVENTKEEVLKVLESFTNKGMVSSHSDIEKFISHYSRKTKQPIYKFRMEVIIND